MKADILLSEKLAASTLCLIAGLRLPDNSRVTLLTRNYLEHWDNGQLSYFDHRFVRIGETDREE